MQELSTQKSRLNDQINDLKSRGKGFELELENIDDTMQTFQTKITQIETNIHAIDETIADIQRNIMTERNLYENIEQQKKDFTTQLNTTQAERESLDSSVYQLNQSKEFSKRNLLIRKKKKIGFLKVMQIEKRIRLNFYKRKWKI
jgi:chromosome segregation ATPase